MANVVEMIKTDHRKVESLFAQYNHSGDHQCAMNICDEIMVHARAEEAEVYGHLPEDVQQHAEEEHQEIEDLINAIKAEADDIAALMTDLEEKVKHHVEEEETNALPTLERSGADLEALGEGFANAKE